MHLQQIQIENKKRKRENGYLQIQEAEIPSLWHTFDYNTKERLESPQNYTVTKTSLSREQ